MSDQHGLRGSVGESKRTLISLTLIPKGKRLLAELGSSSLPKAGEVSPRSLRRYQRNHS